MTHVEEASSGYDDRDQFLLKVREYLGVSTEERVAGQLATAWELFFETHTPLIDILVSRSRLSRHEAEDCVQEVWLEVVRYYPKLRGSSTPAGLTRWLATIVRTQVARQIRANARQPVTVGWCSLILNSQVCADDLHRLADRELVATALARLKQQTSELNYRILHMRIIEELSVEEVADHLDLARAQVRYRHHRAMKRLRKIIRRLPS